MRLCLGAEGAAELRREPCARMPGGFYRGIRAEVCREGSRADRKKEGPPETGRPWDGAALKR